MIDLDKKFAIFLIEQNKTRLDFCKENNIDITSLKNWLKGKILPRVDIAFKIERITNGIIKASDFCNNI